MCGITGYWATRPFGSDELLGRMTAALAHRGPDGRSTWRDATVGLGHTRLAIIDLSSAGTQPMLSADGRFRVVFNGEIYNYRSLRSELGAAGFTFQTHSDTEVIPAALAHWGIEGGLSRLRGMFAFALHDAREGRLLLARDRVGIKPLYVGRAPGVVVWGSEIKSVLASDAIAHDADATALVDFFTLGEPLSPRTAFRAVEELPPGTWLELGPAGERRGRFWDWRRAPDDRLSEADALEELEGVLEDSVRAHLESDVPVAAFLSGGVDSSLLVALLCRGAAPGLHTFNVGFDEPGYDESAFASAVARHVGSQHHQLRIHMGEGSPELLERVLGQYDQPFGDSSSLPTWLIAEQMAKHTKVVISGDGGDEIFGGYDRFTTARRLAMVARLPLVAFAFSRAARVAGRFKPDLGRQLGKVATFSRETPAQQLCSIHTYFNGDDLAALLRPELAAAAEGPTVDRLAAHIPPDVDDAGERLMITEIRTLLHADGMRKVDIASSAHGLEVRTPYLDPAVFDLSMRLPMRMKIHRGVHKALLRRLAHRHLPASVIDRPKQGFAIPFDRWCGPALRDHIADLLTGPSSRSRDWLNQGPVRELASAFQRGSVPRGLSRYQLYQRVFMLTAFETWLRRWSPTA